jgi:hypothetical protein
MTQARSARSPQRRTRGLDGLSLRGLVGRARIRWEEWVALRQVRSLCASNAASVRVCWDLDNTLVDSGTLLHGGATLEDAVLEAEPAPNMLEFFEAVRKKLPEAEHVIVSARRRSLRHATNEWLRRHWRSTIGRDLLFSLPHATVKLWEHLARDAQLAIVDDLCYGHENERPSRHLELIEIATHTADVYLGCDEISQIAASATAVETWARETVTGIRRGGVAA